MSLVLFYLGRDIIIINLIILDLRGLSGIIISLMLLYGLRGVSRIILLLILTIILV